MGLLDILNPLLGPILDKVFPDPKERHEFEVKMAQLADAEQARQHDEMMAQIEVNKVEAASSSLFVAGWRPFIGWMGGVCLGYNVMLAPALHLGTADTSFLQTILLAILGMGAMRSYDKAQGTATATVKAAGQPTVPFALPHKRKKFLGLF